MTTILAIVVAVLAVYSVVITVQYARLYITVRRATKDLADVASDLSVRLNATDLHRNRILRRIKDQGGLS